MSCRGTGRSWPNTARSIFSSLDGGGKGKDLPGDAPLDPAAGWLAMGGMIVLDDFIPAGQPGAGQHDEARRHWLDHPALRAAELRLSPTLATIVGVRVR